jgi:hypothetical protein
MEIWSIRVKKGFFETEIVFLIHNHNRTKD